jgi:hypothetical protein
MDPILTSDICTFLRLLALFGVLTVSIVYPTSLARPAMPDRALGANAPRAPQIPEESGCRVSALRVTIPSRKGFGTTRRGHSVPGPAEDGGAMLTLLRVPS